MNNSIFTFLKKLLPILAAAFVLVFPQTSEAKEDWAVMVFGASQLRGDIWQTFYSPDFETSYYFMALAISKKVYSFTKHLDLELEGQGVKHMGDQHHWEFNGLFTLRWLTFPWNKYIITTFAIGEGLSYATKTPEREEESHGNTSRYLNYLMVDLTFALPETPQWNLVLRLHHRSGIFGIFDDVEGASNALGIGLKYKF
ncbi:MAG: hypothetical protein ABFD82_12890 [Syntrophaceae bacterium]